MDTRILEYMLKIQETGTISAASEELHVSQSAVSQALAKEEALMKTDLFTRKDKKLIPTEAGEVYLTTARKMISIKEETDSIIQMLSGKKDHLLIIALAVQADTYLHSQIEKTIKQIDPALSVYFHKADSSDIPDLLREGYADIGIFAGREKTWPELTCVPLYNEKLVLAVPPEYAGSDLSWNNVFRLPFALPDSNSFLYSLIPSFYKTNSNSFRQLYTCRSSEELLRLSEQGFAAAILPEHLLSSQSASVRYELIEPVSYNMYLSRRTRQNDPSVFNALQKALKE